MESFAVRLHPDMQAVFADGQLAGLVADYCDEHFELCLDSKGKLRLAAYAIHRVENKRVVLACTADRLQLFRAD